MNPHSSPMRRRSVLLAAVVALVLAACGGGAACAPGPDDAQPGAGATPVSSPSPASSSPAPTASPSLRPSSATPTPDRSSAAPTPSASTPSPSASRTSPAPSPSPTPSCPADNAVRSWYYVANDSHRTPGIPDDVRRLLDTYGGRYVGDTGAKVVYLTFDEGYENGFTGRILDELQAAGVSAAFFVTGSYVRDNPELVRRMAAEGHVVANHTDGHPSLPSLAFDRAAFRRELTAVERAYRETTGEDLTRLLRPPMGEYSARSLCLTQRLGYQTVFWSFAHRDWLVDDQPPVAVTLQRLLEGRHNGAIYLLHAVSRSNTEALPRFIEQMRVRGYRFGTLTESLPQG